MDDSLDQIASEAQKLLRTLRRSIRSSVAITRRRLGGHDYGFEDHVANFGETLEWRNEELGWELGRLRTAARSKLTAQLSEHLSSYVANFYALLTVAEHINAEASGAWRSTRASKHKLDALCEVHSQALGVAEDILNLIVAGSPIGAEARWRTLYELSTIAKFIARSPGDVAERYLCSHLFELQKELKLRTETSGRIGSRRRAEGAAALKEVSDQCGQLIERHGKAIGKPYGWAAKRLSQSVVTFKDIENRVQPKARRVRYMEASQHIHGARLSSIKTLSRGTHAAALFVGTQLEPARVQQDLVWTVHEMNEVLADVVYRRQGVPEAIYWSYAGYMFALDAATDVVRSPVFVNTGHLRSQLSISTTPTG